MARRRSDLDQLRSYGMEFGNALRWLILSEAYFSQEHNADLAQALTRSCSWLLMSTGPWPGCQALSRRCILEAESAEQPGELRGG
eukprot:scaffold2216_cov39-Prasinocladus_malaysianus.AAC.1